MQLDNDKSLEEIYKELIELGRRMEALRLHIQRHFANLVQGGPGEIYNPKQNILDKLENARVN